MKNPPLPPKLAHEWHIERAMSQLSRALKVVEAARDLVNSENDAYESQKELARRLIDEIIAYDLNRPS